MPRRTAGASGRASSSVPASAPRAGSAAAFTPGKARSVGTISRRADRSSGVAEPRAAAAGPKVVGRRSGGRSGQRRSRSAGVRAVSVPGSRSMEDCSGRPPSVARAASVSPMWPTSASSSAWRPVNRSPRRSAATRKAARRVFGSRRAPDVTPRSASRSGAAAMKVVEVLALAADAAAQLPDGRRQRRPRRPIEGVEQLVELDEADGVVAADHAVAERGGAGRAEVDVDILLAEGGAVPDPGGGVAVDLHAARQLHLHPGFAAVVGDRCGPGRPARRRPARRCPAGGWPAPRRRRRWRRGSAARGARRGTRRRRRGRRGRLSSAAPTILGLTGNPRRNISGFPAGSRAGNAPGRR